MTTAELQVDRSDYTSIITLNRPDTLNALSAGLRDLLTQALAQAQADDGIRAVVITGAGRGFCSGADLTGTPPEAESSQTELLDEFGWV